ncbi:MAG: alpha/beta hydrolase [Anaerolineaceae bacterium]|nr:alpha/beta hydrolase [Anaerolineaceae bacterium]
MKSRFRFALLAFIPLLFISLTGFLFLTTTSAEPMPEALIALQSDSQVLVKGETWLAFEPNGIQANTGFIIYPGGRVDYRSYAPLARQIAEQGYLVVLLKMPFDLAVFDPNAANEVIRSYPEVSQWAVGGHSLGGAMAAGFAAENPQQVSGLVLWAAYPPQNTDLSALSMMTTSIYASLDGLATTNDIQDSISRLPANTIYVEIESGNHAQFGWYGNQDGDNPAKISRQDQQEQILFATLNLLAGLK